jgi:acyl-CoA thioesterase
MTHPFDAALALTPIAKDRQRGETSPYFGNFNGQFGGGTAAILLKAIMNRPDVAGAPVSLTVNFTAAVKPGPYEISVRPVRIGRTLQHWAAEMSQGETIAAAALATFGQRASAWVHAPLAPPEAPSPEEVALTDSAGSPGWSGHYDFRFMEGSLAGLRGAPPLSEPGSARSLLWLRHAVPRPLDFPGLACASDAFFVRLIQVRNTFPAMGTVSITTQFHADEAMLAAQGDAAMLCRVDSRIFRGNFHDQTAELWSRDGRLLATSHQMVWYAE